jgi:hypothetical protein
MGAVLFLISMVSREPSSLSGRAKMRPEREDSVRAGGRGCVSCEDEKGDQPRARQFGAVVLRDAEVEFACFVHGWISFCQGIHFVW